MSAATGVEEVVLVDDAGNAVGTQPKATVHHERTPLHLAFSCYLFDADGRLLLTRRALHKPTWPGVWTNSFCGHPAPGEEMAGAVRRRGEQELGVRIERLQLALPTFRYDATMPNGVMENELCPVFTAVTPDELRPDPEEVDAFEWVDWRSFRDEVLAGTREVSPWCVEQVAALAAKELSAPPGEAPTFAEASADELPAAARPAG
ncbi:isopentenyl-diphosphate Delta-isomerase [Nocardioides caldifontis]|uniref:isopentenyl-diphosphate Delta-isomerase n=1 Tax=Nocardioides caldifontis TaxID=2588938 RepID=UPI0011E04FE2|nr:isopentenyl-diphosphate Delta-isomerase [Nocardioides caldifontis]